MIHNDRCNIVILGSTGSIGRQTLDIVEQYPERFHVLGLAAHNECDMLKEQTARYHPQKVALTDEAAFKKLKTIVPADTEVLFGLEGLCEIAALTEADIAVIALSGAIGIKPTLAAITANKRVALANKETLVAAGDIVMEEVRKRSVELIPVDSEHSAVFQCLAGEEKYLRNIWLTASGGPFRDFSPEELEKVTVEMALRHPTWSMGPKITVDSASLMNKGLEVIEAHHLFNVDYDHIQVLVQRESVIHSMVELVDGAFIAHLGTADMRIPIQYALTYPERLHSPVSVLDFASQGKIHFEKPDLIRFPALALAYEAGKIGGSMPAVMNAANEVAVQAFLTGRLAFTRIADTVAKVMALHSSLVNPNLEQILQVDAWARETCKELL